MSKWLPRILADELAVTHDGDSICDGRGYPLLRGASNYYSVFYGITWLGLAMAIWQGPVINHTTGRNV